MARSGAAGSSSIPQLDTFWGPHASSSAVASTSAAAEASTSAAAEAERPKPAHRAEKLSAKKVRAISGKKPKSAAPTKKSTKGTRSLVPYQLPHTDEVVFLSPSQLAEISGREVKSSKQMAKMLDHILATC